jgi:hypothetical protein
MCCLFCGDLLFLLPTHSFQVKGRLCCCCFFFFVCAVWSPVCGRKISRNRHADQLFLFFIGWMKIPVVLRNSPGSVQSFDSITQQLTRAERARFLFYLPASSSTKISNSFLYNCFFFYFSTVVVCVLRIRLWMCSREWIGSSGQLYRETGSDHAIPFSIIVINSAVYSFNVSVGLQYPERNWRQSPNSIHRVLRNTF